MIFKRYKERIIIAMLIFFNYSIMFLELYPAKVRMILSTIVVAGGIFLFKKQTEFFRINCSILCIEIILIAFIIISCLVNGFNATFDIYNIFMVLLAAYLATSISVKKWYSSFVDVMCFFGVTGTIIFLLNLLYPRVLFLFPIHTWHGEILIRNCLLGVVQVNAQNKRNFGIFYEPGMFSVFLIFAEYIQLFKIHFNLRKTIIITIAILSTLSTTGYACLGLLLIALLVSKNTISTKNKDKLVSFIGLLTIILLIYFIKNPYRVSFLLSKFGEMKIGNNISMTKTGSGYERIRAMVLAWKAFIDSPILGIGTVGWMKRFKNVIGTTTPINWLGVYGIGFGLLLNYYYFRFSLVRKENKYNIVASAITIMTLLLNIFTQNMYNSFLVLTFIFYECRRDSLIKLNGFSKNVRTVSDLYNPCNEYSSWQGEKA